MLDFLVGLLVLAVEGDDLAVVFWNETLPDLMLKGFELLLV